MILKNLETCKISHLFSVIFGLVPKILLQQVTNLVKKFAVLLKRSMLRQDCRNASGNDGCWGRGFSTFSQSGRSMIEMLGVLAIIAVLSVGGIAGYSKAMHQWKISRQKTQIAELFLQCINLKEDFLREWYKTNKAVPTASIMEAMDVIPDGMKKSSNTNLVDSNHNNIMIYVSSCNGQTSCLEYRIMFNIAITDKSNNLAQEYCVTFLEQAKAIKPYIYYIERRSHDTLSTDDYSSDLFDINKANPVNMRNFCKICEAKSFCALHLKFKI